MSIKQFSHASSSLLLTGALFACVLPELAFAKDNTMDESIDVSLGALESPIFERLLIPPGTQEGAPVTPPYKQEPPAAQSDFRTKPPIVLPPPPPPPPQTAPQPPSPLPPPATPAPPPPAPPPPCQGPNCPK